MKHILYILFFFTTFLFVGCSKKSNPGPSSDQTNNPTPAKSAQKSITYYAFLKKNNSSLGTDLIGIISGNNISLTIPSGTPTNLIATFASSDKSNVYIGNILQKSDVTSVNISTTVNYKVVAQDSSISSYSLIPVFQKSSQKALLSFSFLKIHNNVISSDIIGTVVGNDVIVLIPPTMSRQTLVASFSSSSKSKVYIKNVLQQSGVTANNFTDYTQPINFSIVAEDSTIATYTIHITIDNSFSQLDTYLTNFMASLNVRGLSVAIIKNDKLVYVKSYGYAIQETNKIATNDNLYRIASVSKPITAITILQLAQQGRLSLNQTVFGPNGILGNTYGIPPAGSNKDKITIQNLLDHTSGWTDVPTDPMFYNNSWDFTELITDMVQNRPLTYYPGDTSVYLNFGYCVLGRVIEKVTSQSYEQYVQNSILQTSNISQMKIGGSALTDRFPNEVEYYTGTVYSPYAMNVPRLDACAGWIASATDLARFISRIDRETSRPDILTNTTLQQMYFGSNWRFYGGLTGTNSILARINDTYSFALIVNTDLGSQNVDPLYQAVANIILQNQSWPTYDLF